MTPLPFNLILPQTLQRNIQFALGVLPICLTFAAFWPLWLLASWLSAMLGIPVDAPVRDHDNGLLWAAVLLVAMVCLMAAGYLLGWLINALIARYIIGWPRAKVEAVFLRSEVPTEWHRPLPATHVIGDPEIGSKAGWAQLRVHGAWHFILHCGVLRYGASLFLLLAVVPVIAGGRSADLNYWIVQSLIFTFAGVLFGGVVWYFSEKQYLKARRDEGER